MRVAFVHSGYSRHLMSGIIRVETEIVLALRARGHVAEIMEWPEDQSKALVSQQYFRIVRTASMVYRAVRDFIVAGQYDLVVFMGVGYPETRALPWLRRETKAKFVIIQNGWTMHSAPSRFLITSYMQTVGHLLLADVDALVAVSGYVKSHLATYTDPDRIQVIYPGVDTQRFTPVLPTKSATQRSSDEQRVRARFGITERHILMANGKLAAHKNISTIIRALALIPDAALLLVGSGSVTREKMYRELAVEQGVSKRLHFVGTVPNEKLPELYRAASFFVHAARSEALGIVLLEALASGVPVVAPDVGGVSEAVISGFNGTLYADPRDHQQLAASVIALLSDPERRALYARNGRAYVTARFDWRVIMPQYVELFSRVLKQPSQNDLQPSEGLFGAFA